MLLSDPFSLPLWIKGRVAQTSDPTGQPHEFLPKKLPIGCAMRSARQETARSPFDPDINDHLCHSGLALQVPVVNESPTRPASALSWSGRARATSSVAKDEEIASKGSIYAFLDLLGCLRMFYCLYFILFIHPLEKMFQRCQILMVRV